MDSQQIVEVKALAIEFRQAIEKCKRRLSSTLKDFPSGACGDTSFLLARYLREAGFTSFEYINGKRQHPTELSIQYHAWLQHDKLVVDITADQFPEIDQAVIVTINSAWHQTFKIDEIPDSFESNYSLRYAHDQRIVTDLDREYEEVVRHLGRN